MRAWSKKRTPLALVWKLFVFGTLQIHLVLPSQLIWPLFLAGNSVIADDKSRELILHAWKFRAALRRHCQRGICVGSLPDTELYQASPARVSTQGVGVPDDNKQSFCPRDGDIEPLLVCQEPQGLQGVASRRFVVTPNGANDDHQTLSTLELLRGSHGHLLASPFIQRSQDFHHLLAVRRHDSDVFFLDRGETVAALEQDIHVVQHQLNLFRVEVGRVVLLPQVPSPDSMKEEGAALAGKALPLQHALRHTPFCTRLKLSLVEPLVWDFKDVFVTAEVLEQL
uniref:Putative secreted protein n=1 Tax=Ixodes ricinus TaxID=34613 RepID=A0A147BM75_IXORI